MATPGLVPNPAMRKQPSAIPSEPAGTYGASIPYRRSCVAPGRPCHLVHGQMMADLRWCRKVRMGTCWPVCTGQQVPSAARLRDRMPG
jgi:hypothetical protein